MSVLSLPTPHNSAKLGDFAKTVLMPGDPLRAKKVAELFLEDAKLVNNVRDIQGYTGIYRGTPVSVMASGMGMPSIGIYSYELFSSYGVENIIRIGSIGVMREDIKLRSLIFGMGACTNSNFASQYCLSGNFAPIASFELLNQAVKSADEFGKQYYVGNILSSDTFYCDDDEAMEKWQKMGVLGVEMEAAALYMTAARLGKKALAICTVSDNIVTCENLTSTEREQSFTDMMEVALEVAIMQHKNAE